MIGLAGDIIKFLMRFDPPLTSSRLKNMQTGGNYPIENTKEICGNLPFKIENAVFKTAHWMYKKDFIKHKPEEIISEK